MELKKYHPPDQIVPSISKESPKFMNLPEVKNLDDEIDFLVAGIPWDWGVTSKTGARFGPDKVREISTSLRPYNTYHNLNIFEHLSGVDYCDLPIMIYPIRDENDLSIKPVIRDFENFVNNISKEYEHIAKNDIVPFTIGGDHSITYPELQGLAKVHGPLSLIHFDAHFDSIDKVDGNKYTHASFVKRAIDENLIDKARSIQIGMRGPNFDKYQERGLGLRLIPMEEFAEMRLEHVVDHMRGVVSFNKCFVSLDIDGIDPAYAPGTGTPEPGGFTSREMIKLIRGLKGINLVGADVVEVAPPLDNPNEITSYLASSLLYELISLKAVYERDKNKL